MQYCTAVRKDVMEKQLHPPDVPGPGEYEVESWRKPIRSQLKNAQVSSIGKSQRPPLHVGEKDTPACRYDLTPSIGPQTESRCKSALASRFGTSLRPPLEKHFGTGGDGPGAVYDPVGEISHHRQCQSHRRNPCPRKFGTSVRVPLEQYLGSGGDTPGAKYEVEDWNRPKRSNMRCDPGQRFGTSERPALNAAAADTPSADYELDGGITGTGRQVRSTVKSAQCSTIGNGQRPPLESYLGTGSATPGAKYKHSQAHGWQVSSRNRTEPASSIGRSVRLPLEKYLGSGGEGPGPGAYDADNHALFRPNKRPATAQSAFRNAPKYSMQSKARPPLRGRWAQRIPAPNRYTLPQSVGKQPLSRCKSALASRFGTSLRPPLEKHFGTGGDGPGAVYDPVGEISHHRQCQSHRRNPCPRKFGTSVRVPLGTGGEGPGPDYEIRDGPTRKGAIDSTGMIQHMRRRKERQLGQFDEDADDNEEGAVLDYSDAAIVPPHGTFGTSQRPGPATGQNSTPGPGHYGRAAPDCIAEIVQVQSTRKTAGRAKIGRDVRPPLHVGEKGTPGPGAYEYDNHAIFRARAPPSKERRAGRIIADNGDGTFHVKFERGGRDRAVKKAQIATQRMGADPDDVNADDAAGFVKLSRGDRVVVRYKGAKGLKASLQSTYRNAPSAGMGAK